jgi:hypothetical protein
MFRMAMRVVAAAALVVLGSIGCTTLENAAAKDPRRCERDPTCADKARAADCDTQCANGPDCVDRCREMNASSGQTDPR